LSGRAAFELDGERFDAPAGTLVLARSGTKRTAFAEEPETTILAYGGIVGQAYEVSGWELWVPVNTDLDPIRDEPELEALLEGS
jgi:hypothetical protein